MTKNDFSEELIAPCGMNCKICLDYFGYTTKGKKRKMRCIGWKYYHLLIMMEGDLR